MRYYKTGISSSVNDYLFDNNRFSSRDCMFNQTKYEKPGATMMVDGLWSMVNSSSLMSDVDGIQYDACSESSLDTKQMAVGKSNLHGFVAVFTGCTDV